MKKIFTHHFDWSLVTIAFFSLIASFLIFVNILQASGPSGLTETWMEMNGWAWSPNIGWLSLNCHNDFDGDTVIDDNCLSGGGIDYGLKLETSAGPGRDKRAISGCAWAGNVGWWICFDDPGTTQAPQYGVYLNGPSGSQYYLDAFIGVPANNNDVANSLYHGNLAAMHASILPLEGVGGWSNELGFPIVSTSTTGTLEGCFNCRFGTRKECSLWPGVSCLADGDCQPGGGTCSVIFEDNKCDNCLQYNYDTSDPPVMQSVIAGYNCSGCTLDGIEQDVNNICPMNAYGRNHNSCTHCFDNATPQPAVHYYSTPGLIADYTTSTNDGYGSMCGWAWNQDADTGNGVGWLQFSPSITAGNNPYFQVNSGDIYAGGQIKNINILGSNIYNAFIIETNSNITPLNIWASSTLPTSWSKNRPLIDFPSLNATTGKYTNVLGSLDYTGLTTQFGANMNKYGSSIDEIPSSANWQKLLTGDTLLLDNYVYHDDSGPLTLAETSDLIFQNGTGEQNGSGVIIVEGDVIINHDIKYNSTEPGKLKNIASPVFIIKGDLNIASGVTEISGTFIILGDGVVCPAVGCGSFISSGNGQLKVNGSVLAKKFVLGRTYSMDNQPAELFINDGRLKVNPPAGLQNFSANLPKFTYQ